MSEDESKVVGDGTHPAGTPHDGNGKLNNQFSALEDDATTLAGGIDEEDSHQTGLNHSQPASVMYVPEEGGFAGDANTLVDGQEGFRNGSSSKGLLNSKNQGLKVSLQQLNYNQSKLALDRSINQTVELLYELVTENSVRPIFYPASAEDSNNVLLNSRKAHLALVRQNISINSKSLAKAKIDPEALKEDDDEDVPEFKILKLNLKVGNNSQNTDIVSSLDKQSIARLLEQRLNQQVKYLLNLKDRVDDTSSKVFVTGDLNAGKSTFCNALLRRKILPEDQQPCTSVFCEIIDAKKENASIEEVHAIRIGQEYNIRDETTYEIHPLKNLEDLVYECDTYSLLKVYVLDNRTFQESLLRNGVIDIKLIDAPGLNMDLYQTTQVFSRQEEIDLVVFVVNAENHFTLSAREFIAAAAAEKRYVFIVVNRFDNIRDKNKCINKIMEQVKDLSPDSHKDAKEFVHFVSSADVLDGSPGGGDGPDDGPDDNSDNNRNPRDPNFDQLEASLRKFVLEKRAISKLLPAKSYIINLLNDLKVLSTVNEKIYAQEKQDKLDELKGKVAPKYDEIMYKSAAISDSITKLVERTCSEVYDLAKNDILTTLSNFGDHQVVRYQGLQNLYEYAKQTQKVMIDTILSSVQNSESSAKTLTSQRVDEIIKFGQNTLGEEFLNDKVFNSDLMFTRRRDTIKKKLDDLIDFTDFFDPSFDSMMLWLGIPKDYISGTRQQLNYYNPATLLTSIPKNTMTLKEQIPSQLTLHTLYSSTKLLTTGALIRKLYSLSHLLKPQVLKQIIGPILLGVGGFTVYYLINDIPNAFPRKQARKIKSQIYEMDYAHVNADRISKECRQVLNYPSRQVMNNFQTSIDKRNVEKERLEKEIKDAEISHNYFLGLLDKINNQREFVNEIDLENVNTVD